MFIGSNYVLTDSAEGRTSLGWLQIKVMERVLSHVVSRPRSDTTVRSYHYTLMCLVDGGDSAEIDQDEFQNEVIAGYYQLTPEELTPEVVT